jgi:negative regulator of flagellin synthesis FlgM
MSEVSPVNRPVAATLDQHSRTARTQTQADTTTRGEDQVELSNTAQLLSKIADLPDVRQNLVDRVKSSIADGSYESDSKTDAAIDSLLDDIA